jgi:polyphosphate kinase 2
MAKHKNHDAPDSAASDDKAKYKEELRALQIELVKLQRHVIATGSKLLLLFEGRDGAGKDGTIKRVVEHLSPRETRMVALGTPSDHDKHAWYFQRYVPHLPIEQEIVCFNRSWYNRAGVERVMGFCTDAEYEQFFAMVPAFEGLLVQSGIVLVKYYLDITRDEQKKRLKARRNDPLKQWKISPIDEAALDHWKDYTKARDAMFARSHTPIAPWTIVRADDKKTARLNVIRDILTRVDYDGQAGQDFAPDPDIVIRYDPQSMEKGLIAA